MRIALLSGEYPPQPGGVGDYTACLATALYARGHSVSVLTIQQGRLCCYQAAAPSGPAPAVALSGLPRSLDWSHRAWPAVIAALDCLRPHWLHIQYQTGAYAMQPGINLLPWRLRALPGRPRLAVTFHDLLVPYLFPRAGPLRRWVNHRLARDADALVVTNEADAARLQQFSPRLIPIGSNIPVSPPADFARDAWRVRLGATPGELLVAYFGLLAPNKGVDLLLAALADLALPWRLVIVGGGATAPQDVAHATAIRALATQLGLTERIVATGHLAPAEVSACLLAADLAVLPFRDGASFRRGSLLAALAHGCPVVTTTPADGATLAALQPAAALVPPGDAPALARALATLGADGEARARYAAAGRTLAERFAWPAIAAQHEQCYLEG
ncbi:MAG: glycosyltransferase family 4 protein [Chloroflexi bacterium]|nr:glycosyltransferase family 4 protein [Chloroflexota bacterium]